jgi:hypothetical protein
VPNYFDFKQLSERSDSATILLESAAQSGKRYIRAAFPQDITENGLTSLRLKRAVTIAMLVKNSSAIQSATVCTKGLKMSGRRLPFTAMCLAALACSSSQAWGQVIPLLNPGGEEYGASTPPNVSIDPGGVEPISITGWNSTLPVTAGEEGAEGIGNNSHSGEVRLAFGAVNPSPTDPTPDTNLAEDFILFQETDHLVAAGDKFNMSWFGRAFFHFDVGTDLQTSLFGYIDGGGNLVPVNTLAHPSTVPNVWTQTSHSFDVPDGSPLIGQNLTIGFFTDTPDLASGGFTSIDDVVLSIPSPFQPGDVNEDGFIDLADVQIIADHFREPGVRSDGDLDLNGVVDFSDFRIWKDAAEPGLAASLNLAGLFGQNVPEPISALLASMAGMMLLLGTGRRKRS